ncbi:biopolymer transporter ExbB [Pelagovum pacificum]|uniref:Biopolymer transporter ExbB n=1 Tax=Pelagovum pacificum TaxID=2588711 RepID=A0A5C5GAU6_9RHOB|nr:biopolymer transporter ExbB [Pelagovum pacificum]QQA42079.1 biopolymer transporter ExbB [Pelagovum pacificum]TNY31167.1 biopolymer transporter ExbB [Pelagovum pacificum]
MARRAPAAEPHFSQPFRQIVSMLVVIALVAVGVWFALPRVGPVFLANPYLNGFIALVFLIGVISCFWQVAQLINSVRWIEGFAGEAEGHDLSEPPGLLLPLANLLRSRGARMQLSATSSRSILDSVAQRIDENREITRYIVNLLIFLGLLGTFYGLATTVPGLVATIGSLTAEEGESGADIFNRLQEGLQTQLGGMGVAFASSLLGLAGSLVVGLLELFAGHGQNRFYRELEEWLSSITRVGLSGEEGGEAGIMGQVIDNLAEQMEALQMMFTQTDIGRAAVDERLGDLAGAMEQLAEKMEAGTNLSDQLSRVADGQERLIKVIADSGIEGIDAESRMRLRSIDVQLLRILEEMAAGRQEVMSDLRTDIAALSRAVRHGQSEREGY